MMRRFLAVLALLALSAQAPAPLFQKYVNVTTTALTETNQVAVKIPGGLVSANGMIMIIANYTYTQSKNAKSVIIRLDTVPGGLNGAAILTDPITASSAVGGKIMLTVRAANSSNNQQVTQGGDAFGISQGTGFITSNVDMSQDSYVNFNASVTTAGESVTLGGYTILIFNPAG